MDKKKIDIQENIIDTENFLPEDNKETVKIRETEVESQGTVTVCS